MITTLQVIVLNVNDYARKVNRCFLKALPETGTNLKTKIEGLWAPHPERKTGPSGTMPVSAMFLAPLHSVTVGGEGK